MLSLRLETIRGSFPTEYSGILKGFWARYQWNYHENPYFVSKTHFRQKMDFDIGLVGNFEMHFFTKRHRFWRDLTLTFQTKQKSRKNIQYWKSYVRFLKTGKKGLFSVFVPGGRDSFKKLVLQESMVFHRFPLVSLLFGQNPGIAVFPLVSLLLETRETSEIPLIPVLIVQWLS